MSITKRIVTSQREEFGTGHPAPMQIHLDAVLEYGTPEESIIFDDHRGYNNPKVVVYQLDNEDYTGLTLSVTLEGAVKDDDDYYLSTITNEEIQSAAAGEWNGVNVESYGLPYIKAILTWSGSGLPSTRDTNKADPTGGVLLTFYP